MIVHVSVFPAKLFTADTAQLCVVKINFTSLMSVIICCLAEWMFCITILFHCLITEEFLATYRLTSSQLLL